MSVSMKGRLPEITPHVKYESQQVMHDRFLMQWELVKSLS
jgi:hypothetical protein